MNDKIITALLAILIALSGWSLSTTVGLKSDVAVLKEKVSKVESSKVDLSGIASNEKKIGKNKDAIADVEKKASVNEKTLQLFKLEIEEIKIKSKNPLGG